MFKITKIVNYHAKPFLLKFLIKKNIYIYISYFIQRLRRETWYTIETFKGGLLSRRLRQELSTDPLAPLLNEKYYTAVDRRLQKVIDMVNKCAAANGWQNVLVG